MLRTRAELPKRRRVVRRRSHVLQEKFEQLDVTVQSGTANTYPTGSSRPFVAPSSLSDLLAEAAFETNVLFFPRAKRLLVRRLVSC